MVITCLQPEDHDRIGSCGRPVHHRRGRRLRRRGSPAAGRRARRDRLPRPADDGLLLEQSGGHGARRSATVGCTPATSATWIADGFFYLVDRKNDMLISGGYNVYPREVEDVLLACEGVVEAAVVGLPDEKWGDRVHAVVVGAARAWTPSAVMDARARTARQLQAAEGRRDLARTAEELRQQDPAPRGARPNCSRDQRQNPPDAARRLRSERDASGHARARGQEARARRKPSPASSVSIVEDVRETLAKLVARQARRRGARDSYLLDAAPRAWLLDARLFAPLRSRLRANPDFQAGYEGFERLNGALKQLITDWQTIAVRGERVPNDHGDKDYDAKIIDRLGDLHERAEAVLERLASALPRLRDLWREARRGAREGRRRRDRLGQRRQDRELSHALVRTARRSAAPDAARARGIGRPRR